MQITPFDDQALTRQTALGSLAQSYNQMNYQQQQQMMQNLQNSAVNGINSYNNYQVNQAMMNNVDPTTGNVNQAGALSDLAKNGNNMAYGMARNNFMQQNLAQMKAQGEYAQQMGAANKSNADAQATLTTNQINGLKYITNALAGLNSKDPTYSSDFQSLMNQGIKMGLPIDPKQFGDQNGNYTEADRRKALSLGIGAQQQIDNTLKAQEAAAQTTTAQAAADKNRVELANQGNAYQIANNTNATNIALEQMKQETEKYKYNTQTPQQTFEQNMKINEFNKDSAKTNAEAISNGTDKINALTNTNQNLINHSNNIDDIVNLGNSIKGTSTGLFALNRNIPGTDVNNFITKYDTALSGNNILQMMRQKLANEGQQKMTNTEVGIISAANGLIPSDKLTAANLPDAIDRFNKLKQAEQMYIKENNNSIKQQQELMKQSQQNNPILSNGSFKASNGVVLSQQRINQLRQQYGQ